MNIILGHENICKIIEECEMDTEDCDQDLWTVERQEAAWERVAELYEKGEIGLVRLI